MKGGEAVWRFRLGRPAALACLLMLSGGAIAEGLPGKGPTAVKSPVLSNGKAKEFAENLGLWLLYGEDPKLATSKKRDARLEAMRKLEGSSWKGVRAAFDGWSTHPKGPPKHSGDGKLEYRFDPAVFTKNVFCLGVPPRYVPGQPMPIVLALHGGGRGIGNGEQAFSGYGAAFVPKGCFCIAPTVPGNYTWAMPTSEKFIRYILHQMVRDYSIDFDRIYCVGHSMGGVGAWCMGVRMPDYFAGSVAGAGNDPGCLDFEVLYNTPMFIHHGSNDIQVTPDMDKAAEAAIQAMRPPLRDVTFHWYVATDPRGHSYPADIPTQYEPWLLSKRRDMYPKRVVCTCPIAQNQDDRWGVIFDGAETSQAVFWLGIENRTKGKAKAVAELTKPNTIEVTTTNAPRIAIYVSDEFLDLDQPVVVIVNGNKLHDAKVARSAEFLARHIEESDDHGRFFANKITMDVE